jgi:protein CpxP
MKKYIVGILLVLGLGSVVKGQNKMPTAQELTVKNITVLTERLKLSPTQKNVIYNYTFDMYKAQLELVKKQQAGTSREEDISKFYKYQNETYDNIKQILKAEQVAEFNKVQDEILNGDHNKKKKGKKKKNKEESEEGVVTGISGLKSAT